MFSNTKASDLGDLYCRLPARCVLSPRKLQSLQSRAERKLDANIFFGTKLLIYMALPSGLATRCNFNGLVTGCGTVVSRPFTLRVANLHIVGCVPLLALQRHGLIGAGRDRTPPNGTAACLTVKPVGEPDALIGHVRFDERGWEMERCQMAEATAPSSTVFWWRFIRLRKPYHLA